MLRHALSLLLVASISSCPFLCNLNGALAKAAGGAHLCCCDCCHDGHPSKSQRPDESGHTPLKPGKCCQCICGGAVTDVGNAPLVSFDWSNWSFLPTERAEAYATI